MSEHKAWERVVVWDTEANEFTSVRYAAVLNHPDKYVQESIMKEYPRDVTNPVWDTTTNSVREATRDEVAGAKEGVLSQAREVVAPLLRNRVEETLSAGFMDPHTGYTFSFDNRLCEYLEAAVRVNSFPIKVVSKDNEVVTLSTADDAKAILLAAHTRLRSVYTGWATRLESMQAASDPKEVRAAARIDD